MTIQISVKITDLWAELGHPGEAGWTGEPGRGELRDSCGDAAYWEFYGGAGETDGGDKTARKWSVEIGLRGNTSMVV